MNTMVSNDKNLVIDVTTLIKWNRPPVGIIRTQLEFVNFTLSNNKDHIKYFSFNETKDNFINISKDEMSKQVHKLLYFENSSDEKKAVFSFDIKKPKYKNKFSQSLKNYTIKSVLLFICDKTCSPKAKANLKKAYRKLFKKTQIDLTKKPILNSLNERLFAPEIYLATHFDNTPFDSHSIVVAMGLDWDNSNYPLLYWLKKKIGFEFVGSFYDAIPVTHPDLVQSFYFSQKFFSHMYYLVHLADRVFCISKFSKSQLEGFCKRHFIKNMPDFKTIHLGDSVRVGNIVHTHKREHKDNYVLYVSTIEARKNHALLLDVWTKLLQKNIPNMPDLVLVGMVGWGIDGFGARFMSDEKLKQLVHIYTDVDDKELAYLYSNAKFTVFPSFVEGWGLGAVESMIYGKPCIISDCDALSEATQGLMPVVNANDVDGWANTIESFVCDESIIAHFEKVIRDEFKTRSWQEFSLDFERFAKGVL